METNDDYAYWPWEIQTSGRGNYVTLPKSEWIESDFSSIPPEIVDAIESLVERMDLEADRTL